MIKKIPYTWLSIVGNYCCKDGIHCKYHGTCIHDG
jgi:hypothetical protein